jgi:predicted RNase H-related nuclease YkuK (DUF458 family)
MLEKVWKTIDGQKVPDLLGTLKNVLAEGEREVHIGSDSQQAGRFTEYVTVIVLLQKGKGGRAFYIQERVPRVRSLRERLMREVWMSINVGLELNAHMPETTGLTVHVDANPNLKFRSSDHVKELTAMVVSQGFKTLLKPDSWAASHLADHVVKHKVLGL